MSSASSGALGPTVEAGGGGLTAALHLSSGERLRGLRGWPLAADGSERCLSDVTWAAPPGPCFRLLPLSFPPFLLCLLSGWLGELAGSPPCLRPLTSVWPGWSCSARRHLSGLLGFEAGTLALSPCSVRSGVGGCWSRGVSSAPAPSDFSLVVFNVSGPMMSSSVVEAWR